MNLKWINFFRELLMRKISIHQMPIGIFRIDSDKNIIYANRYFSKISGLSEANLLGKHWLNIIHKDDLNAHLSSLADRISVGAAYEFEFRFKHSDREDSWIFCHVVPESSNNPASNYIGTITDITELKKTQTNLQKMASFDPLTQLPNRSFFKEILNKSLQRAKRNKNTLALFYIDLDNFKNVNDFFGHGIGDIFLKEAANRLKKGIRVEDFVARLGGDEFAIILEDIHNIASISLAAQRLIEDFSKPFIIGKNEITSTLSVGISVYPVEETTADTIIQHADQALYQAKKLGRNCYKYYNKSMQQKLERYMLIVEHLRNAIKENQFELYYQPKIDAQINLLVGIEALLRWNNPFIVTSPAEFIVIAEETGLMSQIGAWVIETAFQQYKEWDNNNKMKDIIISVNISSSQLHDSNIIDTVTQALKATNVPTQNILFELTETAMMKKILDSKSVLQIFLVELGIGISIDDFGTGYSSLTYLKQLPVKELKIDKSFIDDIGKNKNNEIIIKTIINLAETLGLEVVAEGVETKEQLDFLMENQCKIIQGHYFSKPLSTPEMTAYIDSMSMS